MNLDDWQSRMEKSKIMDRMDEEIDNIVNTPDMQEIQKEIYKSIDKNINGFPISANGMFGYSYYRY